MLFQRYSNLFYSLLNRAKQYAWSLDQPRGECGAESCPYFYGARSTQSQLKRELSAQDIAELAKTPEGLDSRANEWGVQQSSRSGRSVVEADDGIEAPHEAPKGGSIHHCHVGRPYYLPAYYHAVRPRGWTCSA